MSDEFLSENIYQAKLPAGDTSRYHNHCEEWALLELLSYQLRIDRWAVRKSRREGIKKLRTDLEYI